VENALIKVAHAKKMKKLAKEGKISERAATKAENGAKKSITEAKIAVNHAKQPSDKKVNPKKVVKVDTKHLVKSRKMASKEIIKAKTAVKSAKIAIAMAKSGRISRKVANATVKRAKSAIKKAHTAIAAHKAAKKSHAQVKAKPTSNKVTKAVHAMKAKTAAVVKATKAQLKPKG